MKAKGCFQLPSAMMNSKMHSKEIKKKKGRPRRYDADYFPHYTHPRKNLEIIIDKYGNEGYAFYYRLQELLGRTDYHRYDYDSELNREYLCKSTGVNQRKAEMYLNYLCELGEIHDIAWHNNREIWWQSFVNSLEKLYNKRINDLPKYD